MSPSTESSGSRRSGRRRSARGSRLLGVDAARGLALLGMMTVHVLPTSDEMSGEAAWPGVVLSGRSAALFALLAGVGLALLSGGSDPDRPNARARWDRTVVAVRAVLIVVIGLAVTMLDTGVAIILVHYGLLFLLALPFLRMGAGALFSLAAGWALAAPPAYWWLHNTLRGTLDDFPWDWRLWHSPSFADLTTPEVLGMDLALTGYYPLLIWPAYLFTGLAVGRLRLQSTSTALRIAGSGGVLAAVTYLTGRLTMAFSDLVPFYAEEYAMSEDRVRGEILTGTHELPLVTEHLWFLLVTPHQGSTVDVLHTIGVALAVLGLCLLVTERLRWPLAPLIGAGAMPLTLYVAHLVVVHLWRGGDDFFGEAGLLAQYSGTTIILGLVIGALAAGLVKHLIGRRGPLEALTHAAGVAVAGPRP